jgi:site-specific DNA-methyltransferase (adenine-specific)
VLDEPAVWLGAARQWVKKAWDSSARGRGATVVCLFPVRADTVWWHDIVLPHAAEVRYIRGRLPFGGMGNSASFASAVVVFRPSEPTFPTIPATEKSA